MKNVKRVIASVAVVLGISMSMSAQNGLSLRAGGNFPVGAFGEGGSMADIALNNAASTLGGAATGLNAGLKYQFNVLGNLGVFASADVFYNGLKNELTEDLKKLDEDVNLPSYVNIPVMLGLNYKVIDLSVASLWAEAGVGVNFRNISSLEQETEILGSEIETGAEYHMAATVAWQAGVGVTLGQKISLGLHYYAFGNSEIKGKPFAEDGGLIGDWADKLTSEFETGKLNPSMMVLRVGYHF